MDPSKKTLAELRDFVDRFGPPPDDLVRQLRQDPRKGARRIASRAAARAEAERAIARRTAVLLAYERRLWRSGFRRVAGVDEVGVGPLAGPVVAAAVVFAPDTMALPVDDSKRLSAARRTELAAAIRTSATSVGIGTVSAKEIDELNIYHAAAEAMRRAVAALCEAPDRLLVDARIVPGVAMGQEAIVGGDGRHYCIAAASIVAKVHRDQIMLGLHRRYPSYGFDVHKGYPTPQHRAALRAHGLCPEHRRSFACLPAEESES